MSKLLERLRKFKDDRGMMANLRCIHVESKKHRAWPALNRLGVAINDPVPANVAGLYATHPEETTTGNFGNTCKAIEQQRGDKRSDDNKPTPTERRFHHLLSAEGGTELFERILRMVLMAKSQGVPINYAQLQIDLNPNFWANRTRIKWATAFWKKESSETEDTE